MIGANGDSSGSFDIGEEVGKKVEEALKEQGRVNVVIAGRSGVGKSTLINAVFQGQLAATGQGRPVTPNTREITKEGIPLTVFDTRGLEMDRYRETLSELERFVKERGANTDPKSHLHVAWVCVSEDSRRVEEGESRMCEMLAAHMPVLGVVTKAREDRGFRADVQKLLPQARNVVRVRALSEDIEGHIIQPRGLPDLVEATMEVVPEGHRNAFVAAQRVSMSQKKTRAFKWVVGAAATAATVGATPIPFSDAIVLVPIQVGMLAQVSAVFGLPLTKAFLGTLVSSAIGSGGASLAGRAIVSGLLKLIPGANVLGMVISGATAAALTTLIGEIYIETLVKLMEKSEGQPPTGEEISEAFGAIMRARKALQE